MIGRSFLQSSWEQTQAPFFYLVSFLSGLSGSFNVTVDMQVGQANVFPSPSTFFSVVSFSRQVLQNE